MVYLSLTLHFVDTCFEMHDVTLEVTPFPGKHNGVAIAAKLCEVLGFWELDNKIVSDFAQQRKKWAKCLQLIAGE